MSKNLQKQTEEIKASARLEGEPDTVLAMLYYYKDQDVWISSETFTDVGKKVAKKLHKKGAIRHGVAKAPGGYDVNCYKWNEALTDEVRRIQDRLSPGLQEGTNSEALPEQREEEAVLDSERGGDRETLPDSGTESQT